VTTPSSHSPWVSGPYATYSLHPDHPLDLGHVWCCLSHSINRDPLEPGAGLWSSHTADHPSARHAMLHGQHDHARSYSTDAAFNELQLHYTLSARGCAYSSQRCRPYTGVGRRNVCPMESRNRSELAKHILPCIRTVSWSNIQASVGLFYIARARRDGGGGWCVSSAIVGRQYEHPSCWGVCLPRYRLTQLANSFIFEYYLKREFQQQFSCVLWAIRRRVGSSCHQPECHSVPSPNTHPKNVQ